MAQNQTPKRNLPQRWLLSDARNDARLEHALPQLPAGSGFIFRHYHLAPDARRKRFDRLAQIARASGHVVALSSSHDTADSWGAAGVYGDTDRLGKPGRLIRLATAHNRDEIIAANNARADGVFLSPVYSTQSHPGGAWLGPFGFSVLSQIATVPVIALGGMDEDRARALGCTRWGAIDAMPGKGRLPPSP